MLRLRQVCTGSYLLCRAVLCYAVRQRFTIVWQSEWVTKTNWGLSVYTCMCSDTYAITLTHDQAHTCNSRLDAL